MLLLATMAHLWFGHSEIAHGFLMERGTLWSQTTIFISICPKCHGAWWQAFILLRLHSFPAWSQKSPMFSYAPLDPFFTFTQYLASCSSVFVPPHLFVCPYNFHDLLEWHKALQVLMPVLLKFELNFHVFLNDAWYGPIGPDASKSSLKLDFFPLIHVHCIVYICNYHSCHLRVSWLDNEAF